MRELVTLWRRELASYFTSPAVFVAMVLVLAVTGVGFSMQAALSRGSPLRVDILVFWLPTLWLMVLISATMLTARLFAEEKRSGTIETLMTAPVTESQVVLGKYAAALVVFVVTFLPTTSYMWFLRRFSSGMDTIDARALVAGYGMFFLMGAFYVSIGVLVSAMSRNVTVAAIACFALLIMLFILLGAAGHVLMGKGMFFPAIVSPFAHISDYSRGVMDSRHIVFYLSGIAFSLFAAVKVVESRRWL